MGCTEGSREGCPLGSLDGSFVGCPDGSPDGGKAEEPSDIIVPKKRMRRNLDMCIKNPIGESMRVLMNVISWSSQLWYLEQVVENFVALD